MGVKRSILVPMSVSVIIIIFNALLAAFGQVFLKMAMNLIYNADPPIEDFWGQQLPIIVSSPYLYLGLFSYGLSVFVWLIVLSREELGLAGPLLSFSFLFVLLFSWLLLGEKITVNRYIGTPIICVGIAIILLEKRSGRKH